MKSIAIIGAGIAGITLARQLQGSAKVSVFEKSRGFGGRMATRRHGSYQFDHGAQFFTARSKQFQKLDEPNQKSIKLALHATVGNSSGKRMEFGWWFVEEAAKNDRQIW